MEKRNYKLKLLYTIPNFDTAGSGKVLYDLANGLDKDLFEVHIACSHSRGNFFKEIEQLNLPIHLIATTCTLKPYYSIFQRIKPYRNFVKNHGFDIIHSWHWSSDWTEVLGAKLGGAKFVYTKKAMTWGNIHWKIRSYLSDFIITINDEMKAYFPAKKQQQLIPLGLDTDYYSRGHFPDQLNDDVFRIITVANLVAVKGIEVLIDAVLALNNKKIVLTILGDDRSDYAKALKQKVLDLNQQEKINFLGKHTDVRPFLAQSDLYVIPTLDEGRKEGMPMALVEAMSMGIPVLGSNITGINYVLKSFPELLFEASNSKQLTEKIFSLYQKSTSEKQQIGKELRQYVLVNFSMERFITKHQQMYLSLVKK